MDRATRFLRISAVAGLAAGVAFLAAPATTTMDALETSASNPVAFRIPGQAGADSLAEDIILYNLFAPSRSAPSRRAASSGMASGQAAAPGGDVEMQPGMGFQPALVGTAVSDRPGETRALLQLDPADPAPRLYAVGDQAGGYRVVSITAREVVVTGPRGRIVLRLPQREEENS